MALGKLEPCFLNTAIVKNKKEKRKMKYAGPMAACFKRGHSSTPKNAAIAQENATLDAIYGCMFKIQPLLFL